MEISKIKIGERHRKDLGDILALSESIKTEGLLQPIGVTGEDELVFGYRRIIACRDHLGWTEIEARVVNVTSIVAGEYAENEMRKDFSISERAAILDTIEHKSKGGDRRSKEFFPLKTTRDEAAKMAGFGNPTTARQALTVVNDGIPELVAAVDSGDITIWSGFAIATQPPKRQAEIIKLPKRERQDAVRELDRPGGTTRRQRNQESQKHQPSEAALKREEAYLNRPRLRDPGAEKTGRPEGDERLEQAPGWPKGINKGMAFTAENGRVQPFPLDEVERQKLYARLIEFNAMIRKLTKPEDWPTYDDLARLDDRRRDNVLREWRRYSSAIEAIRPILDATIDHPEMSKHAQTKAMGGVE